MAKHMTELPSYVELKERPELWPAVELMLGRLNAIKAAAKNLRDRLACPECIDNTCVACGKDTVLRRNDRGQLRFTLEHASNCALAMLEAALEEAGE